MTTPTGHSGRELGVPIAAGGGSEGVKKGGARGGMEGGRGGVGWGSLQKNKRDPIIGITTSQ